MYYFRVSFTDIPPWFLFNFAIRNRDMILHCGAGLADEAETYFLRGFRRVLWIEANRAMEHDIRIILDKFPNQELIIAALWDDVGCSLPFYVSDNLYSSSILRPNHHLARFPQVHFEEKQNVVTETLDNLDLTVSKRTLLVLDLQGAELRALKGGVKTLHNVECIYTEYSIIDLFSGGSTLAELHHLLKDEFKILLKIESKEHGYGNALFVRKEYRYSKTIGLLWNFVYFGKLLRFRIGTLVRS